MNYQYLMTPEEAMEMVEENAVFSFGIYSLMVVDADGEPVIGEKMTSSVAPEASVEV